MVTWGCAPGWYMPGHWPCKASGQEVVVPLTPPHEQRLLGGDPDRKFAMNEARRVWVRMAKGRGMIRAPWLLVWVGLEGEASSHLDDAAEACLGR